MVMTSPPRRKGDRRRLLEEGEGLEERGGDMDGVTASRDPEKQSSAVDKSPTSCLNIAFGEENDQDYDEEEEKVVIVGEGDEVMLVKGEKSEGALLRVSPQR